MTPRRFGRIKIEKDWRELEEMAAAVAAYEGPITRCPRAWRAAIRAGRRSSRNRNRLSGRAQTNDHATLASRPTSCRSCCGPSEPPPRFSRKVNIS